MCRGGTGTLKKDVLDNLENVFLPRAGWHSILFEYLEHSGGVVCRKNCFACLL